ncbi:CPBP family intramembrane glutamic endopeptidase [Spirochaeta cellobiosiphila]|uniref:CPBP family intramembrane glutamic endopeptidase n=1 Tax=Spirochaeta cellobiosiphila TaxID=504483 RepID=UPI0004285E43|nr:type II CAAX endopeptidase family protein [Spirochaeta cellobiosiphila]
MNKNKISLYEPLLIFAVFYLPGIFTGTLGNLTFSQYRFHFLYALSTIPEVLLLVYIVYLKDKRLLPIMGIRKWNKRDSRHLGFHFLVLIAVIILIQSILYLATLLIPIPEVPALPSTPLSMIPFLLITSLLTGIREELYFRSYLLTLWKPPYISAARGILLSSLLFASGHLYLGWPGVINSFILGLFFCWLYKRTRSLWQNALIHGLYDFSILLIVTLIPT